MGVHDTVSCCAGQSTSSTQTGKNISLYSWLCTTGHCHFETDKLTKLKGHCCLTYPCILLYEDFPFLGTKRPSSKQLQKEFYSVDICWGKNGSLFAKIGQIHI